ncbi:MAG: hypothetical protein EOP45_21385 [Sphingobacteriaceae bacterium]|nr:MAG: hypothetical protein EOP45_21385 [Sphingobacteriaceae bacterium]
MAGQAQGAGLISAALLPLGSPIEQAWSKLKTAMRPAQAQSRTALEAAVQAAIDWINIQDTQHLFDHCGYHVQLT